MELRNAPSPPFPDGGNAKRTPLPTCGNQDIPLADSSDETPPPSGSLIVRNLMERRWNTPPPDNSHRNSRRVQGTLAGQHRVGHIGCRRRYGRVAEGGGLLNRYRVVKPYRGFESLCLRHPFALTRFIGLAPPLTRSRVRSSLGEEGRVP